MKKICLFLFCFISFNSLFSQDPPSPINFYQLLDYLYENDSSLQVHDTLKSGSAKDIDRTKFLWGPRLSPDGDVSKAAAATINYTNAYTGSTPESGCGLVITNWREEGPFGTVSSDRVPSGTGQINRITFDPRYGISSHTIYGGSFYGGLWRSTNKGESWEVVNTDLGLPQTSVSGIAVSHQDSSIIYISTGQGDLRTHKNLLAQFNAGFSGVAPSFTSGVFRSTDYGQSWQAINTGFLTHFTSGGTTRDLMVNPENDNTLYCATSLGFFRCRNALSGIPQWTKLNFPAGNPSDDFAGIALHPTDTNTLYAASEDIYRSTDGGDNWASMTGPGTGLDFDSLYNEPDSFFVKRIKLAVTPADSSRLYAYINGMSIKMCPAKFHLIDTINGVPIDTIIDTILPKRAKTIFVFMYNNNQWERLNKRSNCTATFNNYSETWMGFAVSPKNPNMVFYGYTKVRGTNDFTTQPFFNLRSPYLAHDFHADVHDIVFEPNTDNPLMYCGTHGGVNVKNTNDTAHGGWEDKNEGINTNLIFSFDISKVDGHIVIGRQDNGSNKSSIKKPDGTYDWTNIGGGDGYGTQMINEATKKQLLVIFGPGFNVPIEARAVAMDSLLHPTYWDHRSVLPLSFQAIAHPVLNKEIIGFTDLFSLDSPNLPHNASTARANWRVESDLYRHQDWKLWSRIREFAIAPSDTNYIYVATWGRGNGSYTELFRSKTGLRNGSYDSLHYSYPPQPPGKFQPITQNLPQFYTAGDTVPPYITGIAVSSKDPEHLWISVSGFEPGIRVLKSTDGGDSWQNADPNNDLPEMPANNIIYQDGTDDRLYLATDVGVFVTDNEMGCWQRFGDIPNVKVLELKMHPCSGRIYAGTYGRGLWSAAPLPASENKSRHIVSTNTTWTTNRALGQDLLVKAGAKLTIKSTLYMPADADIIIEPNAILVVDSGKITNSCGYFWNGIQVHGNSYENQFPLSHPTYQGKLVLKNGAEIENAREAIRLMDADNWGTFGGLVQARDATIRNNRRAVTFMKYDSTNHSFFRNVKFINDSNIRQIDTSGTLFLSRVTLWDNKGVIFEGCEFVDSSGFNQYSPTSGNGIFSIDAKYTVRSFCTSPLGIGAACPTGDLIRTTFTNLNQGIYALGASKTRPIIVDRTDFIDNSIGLRIKGINNVRFTNNELIYGGVMKQGFNEPNINYQYGLYGFETSDFEIEANEFEGRSNPVMDVAGLGIFNSGTDANEVYRNTFENNTLGQHYVGRNRNNSFQGLQFLCNENPVSNDGDVHVELDGDGINPSTHGIRTHQGSSNPEFSAGNLVSSNPDPDQGHLKNTSDQVINYHYFSSDEKPLYFTTSFVDTNLLNSNSNTCPIKLSGFPITHNPGQPTWAVIDPTQITEYYANRNTYNGLLYNYYQQLDNGNTDSLIQAINMTVSADAQQLRDDLIAQSPFVSTPALMDAASTGILSDALLLEVCLANPDATQSEGFLDFVEYEIPNPLPSSMVQLIYQSWSEETPRTLLEMQLAELNGRLGHSSMQILQHYLNDSLKHSDSIVSILESRNSLQSDYRIVEWRVGERDFVAANDLMQQIAGAHEFNEAQLNEHNNLLAFIDFLSTLAGSEGEYMNTNPTDSSTLRDIANAATGRSSVLAQNILCFAYGDCADGGEEIATRMKRNSYPKRVYDLTPPLTDQKEIDHQRISLHPNPADEEVRLRIANWENEAEMSFQLISLQGQVLINRRITEQETILKLAHLKKGAYFYKVLQQEEVLESGKLIIQ